MRSCTGSQARPDARAATRPGIMVRRDHGRGGTPRFRRASGARRSRGVDRPVDARRPGGGMGPVGAAPRAPGGALPRRQLPARADGPRGREPDPPGPPAAHELVPLPRAGVTPVPALPEPAVHDRGDDRHGGRPGHRVPLVDIPAARAVATRRVLERPALRPQPVDRRLGCGRLAVPGLGGRHRLRDEGLRLGRLRGVDPAVGVVDAAVGVGLHLPGTEDAAGRAARRPLHHADGRPALRDRVPRVRPPRGVALPGALGPVAPAGARRRARRRRGGGVGLGHRPAARPVTLGRAQPGARAAPGSRTGTAPVRCCRGCSRASSTTRGAGPS